MHRVVNWNDVMYRFDGTVSGLKPEAGHFEPFGLNHGKDCRAWFWIGCCGFTGLLLTARQGDTSVCGLSLSVPGAILLMWEATKSIMNLPTDRYYSILILPAVNNAAHRGTNSFLVWAYFMKF